MWRTHGDRDRGLSAAASVLVDLGTTRDYDNLDLSFQTEPPGRRALDLEDAQTRGAKLILQKTVGAGDLR
jgi:hypothetical protein